MGGQILAREPDALCAWRVRAVRLQRTLPAEALEPAEIVQTVTSAAFTTAILLAVITAILLFLFINHMS